MSSSTLPVGQGYSTAQWEAWFTANTKNNPKLVGTSDYHGTQLQGKTWAQVYQVVYNYAVSSGYKVPAADKGDSVADAAGAETYGIAVLDGIGVAASDTATAAGDATAASDTGIEKASILPSWATGLAELLSDLTDENLWIRVGKIVIGSALIIIGISKMTGASNVITKAVENTKVIPL